MKNYKICIHAYYHLFKLLFFPKLCTDCIWTRIGKDHLPLHKIDSNWVWYSIFSSQWSTLSYIRVTHTFQPLTNAVPPCLMKDLKFLLWHTWNMYLMEFHRAINGKRGNTTWKFWVMYVFAPLTSWLKGTFRSKRTQLLAARLFSIAAGHLNGHLIKTSKDKRFALHFKSH